MSGNCDYSRNFSTFVNYPPSHSFWTHIPTCPDCQALVNAYREFKNPAENVDLGFDLDKADTELAGRLESALNLLPLQSSPGNSIPKTNTWWLRKELWYSTAAILLIGAGIFSGQSFIGLSEPRFNGDSSFVRGGEATSDGFFCSAENGCLKVTWPDNNGADQVQIMFFDKNMIELLSCTSVVQGPFQLSPSPLAEQAVYVQIFYLEQRDVLKRGPIFSVVPVP